MIVKWYDLFKPSELKSIYESVLVAWGMKN